MGRPQAQPAGAHECTAVRTGQRTACTTQHSSLLCLLMRRS